MAFVNMSLLAGGLLVSVPIILHFVMRQQPKLLEFPAVRFIQKRQQTNQRKLRVKHWLLLLLRCLAIAGFAAALARPSVAAASVGNWIMVGGLTLVLSLVTAALVIALMQRRGRSLLATLIAFLSILLLSDVWMITKSVNQSDTMLLGDQEAPVAALLIVDTSPRMAYRHSNVTRLEKAQEIGDWLLRQLPDESDVAVIDARPQRRVFSVDLAAAANALKRFDITNNAQPLTNLLSEALQLADTSRKSRKEVYIFTDLTRAAWNPDSASDLQQRLEAAKDVQVFLVDVGVENPDNLGLGDIDLPTEVMTRNNQLVMSTDVLATGRGGRAIVELRVEKPEQGRPRIRDGKPLLPVAERRQQHEVNLDGGGVERINFSLKGLDVGVHHGTVELLSQDGLSTDNLRHFSVRVSEAWNVLVVRPSGGIHVNFTEAIAPYAFRQQGRAQFDCDTIVAADMASKKLVDYAAVVLLDPGPLAEDVWERLFQYASGGGGVAIFLGHNARKDGTFASDSARKLIGAKLKLQWRTPEGQFLIHRQSGHPILAPFKKVTSVPWEQFPVYRHWAVDSLHESAQVLLSYSESNKPALIETQPGSGRVLCLTTSISDPLNPSGRETWNEIATGGRNWPYFLMINELMRYVVKSGEAKLNYVAGEIAQLQNDPRTDPVRYQLFTPRGELQNVATQDDHVTVRSTDQPGAYRLKGERGGVVLRGFAVNLPVSATDLTRTTPAELVELLQPLRFQYARSKEEIVFGVREERVGREFYPFLMALVAIFLGLEHLLANRFYKREG